MAPAKIDGDGNVSQPLDEYTRAIVRETLDQHVATCPLLKRFEPLYVDFYGRPGEKDEHPGVLGNVLGLLAWRRRLTKAFCFVLGTLGGAAAGVGSGFFEWLISLWKHV